MALNAKRRAFVREYVKDFNAAQAAIRAGYAKNSARQTGHDLLTNPDVHQAITEIQQEAHTKAVLTLSELQEWWTKLIQGQDPDARPSDRLKASELLAKTYGAFTERIEQNGHTTIEVTYADN